MDWIQVLAIVGSIVGIMAYFVQRLEKDMGRIERDIHCIGDRLDKHAIRMDGHATRIDQLYKMFVDLLQAKK